MPIQPCLLLAKRHIPSSFWLMELIERRASGIRKQRGALTPTTPANPGLFQEGPDVLVLLPERGDNREQTAAAERSFAGLDAMTDLAVDHRLPQRSLSGVVGGFDALKLQKRPEGLLLFEQLTTGAHRSGPGCCFSPLEAQFHHPLQRLLKGQPHRLAPSPQAGPVDWALFPLLPLSKQLLLQSQQFGANLRADALPFGNGRQITDQVRPAKLALTGGQG